MKAVPPSVSIPLRLSAARGLTAPHQFRIVLYKADLAMISPATLTRSLCSCGFAATTLSLVGAAFLFNPNPARSAQFSGPYDPSNWTLDNSNADGFVDLTQIPIALELVGGNNGSRLPGETAYTTTAVSSGRVSFAWSYLNPDSAFWDRFGFLLNGTFEQITGTSSGSLPQSGTFSTAVRAGDRFGFAMNTLDNDFGAARVTISDFSGPTASNSIPEPTSGVGLLAFSILGMGAIAKRTQSE